jgi:hypothetical protein
MTTAPTRPSAINKSIGTSLPRLVVTLLLIALAACGRSQPPPVAASPVLSQYHAIYDEIGDDTVLLMAHLYPQKPGLELDDTAEAGTRERLIAALEGLQPQVSRIIELSAQPVGPFPPEPRELGQPQWPRSWLTGCTELLQADSGRLWEAGRPDDAIVRLTAQIRIGNQMMQGSESLMQMWGLARVGTAAIRANAIIDAGGQDKVAGEHRTALAEAAQAVQVKVDVAQQFPKLASEVRNETSSLLERLERK